MPNTYNQQTSSSQFEKLQYPSSPKPARTPQKFLPQQDRGLGYGREDKSARDTALLVRDASLIAEAVRRAEMAVLTRELDDIEM